MNIGYVAMVVEAYLQFLFREPGEADIAYWVGDLESGQTIQNLHDNIMASDEFKRVNGKLYTPEDFFSIPNHFMVDVAYGAYRRKAEEASGQLANRPEGYSGYEGSVVPHCPDFPKAVTAFLEMIEAGGSTTQFNNQVLGSM